jgi:hypothetical protein
MKHYFLIPLFFLFFFSCKRNEELIYPVINIETNINTAITPKPDKVRIVLFYGRGNYNFNLGQNPAGNPDKRLISSVTNTFSQILGDNNKVFFNDLPIDPAIDLGKKNEDAIFIYDTLFIRLEARQIIGKDTLFKNNDLNPVSIVFPRDIKGNTTVNRSVNVTL